MQHQEFVVLHNVKLKGFASTEAIAVCCGSKPSDLEKTLNALRDAGLVMFREGRISGWGPTPTGRDEHAKRLAEELISGGHADAVRARYEEFLVHNASLLEVCTAWQVRDLTTNVLNDHLDADYDDAVRDRLGGLHEAVVPICRDVSGRLPRFEFYEPRFEHALTKVRQGLNEWFARPIIDSYHTVWMEMHEDLLATLSLERASEGH